jgi:hypothetical protein
MMSIAPADEREDGWLCFYEILANHFVRVPESGRRILELIVQLWIKSFATNIFALLFHKCVCCVSKLTNGLRMY